MFLERRRGRTARHTIDPSSYQCTTLASQLADEWLKMTRHMALSGGGSEYSGAVRSFAKFTDKHLSEAGMDPAEARLDEHAVDLVEVLYAWEGDLRQKYGPKSKQPYRRARALLALIDQRATVTPGIPGRLRQRAKAPASYGKPTPQPLDEFSNAERIALRDAARAAVRATEARLDRGRELLAAGTDPRVGGWRDLPNLVWATQMRMVNSQALQTHLPVKTRWWPPEVVDLLPAPEGERRGPGVRALGKELGRLLFPDEFDLQAFRVLLLLGMTDTTPEELHDLQMGDVEFTDDGLRVVQKKLRASRIRADLHPEVGLESGDEDGVGEFTGGGSWDVPGLMRRLLAATTMIREVFDPDPYLFVAVRQAASGGELLGYVAQFAGPRYRFGFWIASQRDGQGRPLKISEPYEVRRLRKTTKVVRAVALGGTVSDLAGDDHHVEVYRGHYGHGTTAHIMAGRAINRSQEWVFNRLAHKPMLVDEAAEEWLDEPEVAEELGMDIEVAKAMRAGELDMGLTNCRNPYDSPQRTDKKLCHVAPAMCMLCRNAVIFYSQLPRLLLMSDRIERMRTALPPPRWHAIYGQQRAALDEVFAECADRLPAARQQITELGIRLDLPLGQRTEFDR
ncbi:hypothetical protein [Streptomyces evansiae]|uniref:hypothetical protein n=1 Tax=Streptomyces evansiae TaxID=3075535 RepID=UPI00288743E6|nr:hypothetical protein [Streptomyces sp. DSM 41859]MDT0425387.1 hypothetical protein [Streptomyces sp. DSM 41859]